jgi:LmbE family N-acetylglucosaminyl deacetylase
LLVLRPHFKLRGKQILHAVSAESCAELTDFELRIWNTLQQPASVDSIRTGFGKGADAVIGKFLQAQYCDAVESTFPANRRKVLVVEPHADDSTLSIGGTLWLRRHECEFVIATMATRSNHAYGHISGSGFLHIDDATQVRRLESEHFARIIGGTHVAVGMTDAALRYRDDDWTADFYSRHRISVRVRTSRAPDAAELRIWTDAVKRLLIDHPSEEIWIPLGGPHTDHILTAASCFAAFRSDPAAVVDRTIRIYSEFPYAARYPHHMRQVFAALEDSGIVLEESRIPIDGVRDQKTRLASIYDSQNIQEMLPDTDASASIGEPAGSFIERLWAVRRMPVHGDPSARILAVVSGARDESVARWLARNRTRERLRIVLLVPSGRWPEDLSTFEAEFPNATFDVYASPASQAEVADHPSERVKVRPLGAGMLAWLLLSVRFVFSPRGGPVLVHVSDRRLRLARLLARSWLRSDTMIVTSIDSLTVSVPSEPAAEPSGAPEAVSSVGVVVIGRNEGPRLRRCLESGVRESGKIVYVDSGSSDGSVALARSMGLHTVELDPGTPFSAARARNAGFDELLRLHPDLSFVQFVDGDCELYTGWLAIAATFLRNHERIAVISGRLREKYPEQSVYNTLCDMEWDVPAGEVKDCGGIAMMRRDAFQEVHGFRVDLIAGEEPELCVRLRKRGWRIWRLRDNMSWHDSAMTRFGQWWRREQRAGHAFAEGAELHGSAPENHYVREFRSALVWGLAIPVIIVALTVMTGPAGLISLLVYPAQIVRLALQGKRTSRENWLRAAFLVMGKFPEMLGEIRFFGRRTLGRRPRLIEYK